MIKICDICSAKYNDEEVEVCPICQIKDLNLRIPKTYKEKLDRKEYFRKYRQTPKWKKYNREWMRKYRVDNKKS